MSEHPHDRPSNDPANTQMFRAFVERGEEESGRRWVLPVVLLALLVIAAVVVVLITLS
jgi:hypothetical protein